MPDENESNALAKIKGYLDSGHSLEEVRGAGWGSWIDHLEAIGYDVETARLRLEPPTEAVPQDMVMDAASSVGKVAAHQVILEEEITEVLNDPAVQAQLYVKTSNYPNEEARAARILEVEQTLVEIQVALDDWIGQFVEKTGCELCREWLAQPSTRHHYWLVTAEAEGLWAAQGSIEDKHRGHQRRWWQPLLMVLLVPVMLVAFVVGILLAPLYWILIYMPWRIAYAIELTGKPPMGPGQLLARLRPRG